ncbi:integrin alpha-4 [Biomphalaria glabrata]|uniref:Integrin alpha-4-like n=1 Tax=Biomphalaria glabrata TaxID=6526 RepID=A0A9W2ZGJ0_BIOGL|nr:integrin alpha-4-like [Biomphalaria glabrata]
MSVSNKFVYAKIIRVVSVLIIVYNSVIGFNVDTESALVFKGPKNSYFGYSVAILANSQGTWLLAGAPRANDSSLNDVHEPGAVFQCNWQYRSSCQPVYVDSIGNEKQTLPKWKNTSVHHLKDNQWLGTSIDVNVNGDFKVMICAPRWINQKYSVQGFHFMNGICYEADKELHFDDTSVRPVLEHFKKQVHSSGAYQIYGMGGMGMSAVYSKDGSYAFIGAPGINDWAGGYVQIDRQYTTKPQIREMSYEMDKDSYFGMSMTTAKLSTEDMFILIGGPRAGGYGKVYAYSYNYKLILVKEGDQLGSMFGSSLCAADVNGDKLDDLIVGAPFYSDQQDEGRVYVFINREFFNLELDKNLLAGSNTVGSRFGTSVANLGDLNLDRFEDIAVGAPYEEESGVVYIYNGAKSGLNFKPSQRIVGKTIASDLKTFGWSFSRPWDVDSNHYADFAVGAYESSKVVLLRTRSVVDLNATLELSSTIIDRNSKPNCIHQGKAYRCIEVTVCLQYSGRNLPPSSDVNVTLKLDTLERHRGERSRLFMQGPGFTEIETFTDIITIRLDKRLCPKKYIIYTRESRDVFTPLRIDLDYDIASSSIGIASLCTICPIKNIYNPTNAFAMAYYSLECKGDHSCLSDFTVMANPVFKNGEQKMVIDNSPYFDLELTLTNNGEISYLTMLVIDYPLYLHYTNTRVVVGGWAATCLSSYSTSSTPLNTVSCDILNPVKHLDEVVLSTRFYAHSLPYGINSLNINVSVITVNRRIGQTIVQKSINVTIPVHIASEMEITGSSVPGQLQISMLHQSLTSWETLSHVYVLSNHGPSPMSHSQLIFQVPTNHWLKIVDVKVETKSSRDDSQIPVECNLLEHTSETNVTYSYSEGAILNAFLKCEPPSCSNVTCYVGTMYTHQQIYITVSLSLRSDALLVAKIDNFGLVTSCQLQEPSYTSYTSLTSIFNVTTMTYIGYKSPLSQAMSWWALIISAASGILILYILVVLLWKCGFFKRKKKEELQKLIQYFEFEREIQSDSGSARSSDLMVLPPGLISLSTSDHSFHHSESPLYPPSPDGQIGPFSYRDNYFFSHSLNRRQNADEQAVTFHTLQYHNNNKPLLQRPRNHHRSRDGSHNSHRKLAPKHSIQQRQNIWLPPQASPPPAPPPSFNNELYLEPLESRA